MNRKQRRQRKKIIKKSKVKTSELDQKLGLFDLLPTECMICSKGFDKTSKAMVQSWNVVVREKEQVVRVYCPECWTKATNLLNELGIKPDERQAR
tara:strand:+ start:964 stop:1248 length:285 start_codon:yes stop_codon:yes gene_type:complete